MEEHRSVPSPPNVDPSYEELDFMYSQAQLSNTLTSQCASPVSASPIQEQTELVQDYQLVAPSSSTHGNFQRMVYNYYQPTPIAPKPSLTATSSSSATSPPSTAKAQKYCSIAPALDTSAPREPLFTVDVTIPRKRRVRSDKGKPKKSLQG